MKNAELNMLIGSLKAQVSVLEAKVKQAQKPAKAKTLADFYGIFSKFGETTDEEINAVKFRLKENIS